MPTPLRVLILEDQPTDAELFLHQLRQAGFDPEWQRVETEQDYLSALSPDLGLILADYSLPQFDARRALNLLQGRGLDIPFIVITGSISEEVAVECIKQGATDYLLKDRLTRLGQAVTHALDQKRLRDERKQAEEALRNSEARYRVLFEQSPNGVLLMDPDTGKTIEANETAHKQLGYTREEFAALRISDYEVLEKPEDTARHMQKIIHEGNDDFETLHRTKSGEIRNVHVWAKTVQVSDRALFHAIFQDITERKRDEAQIVRQLQRITGLRTIDRAITSSFDLRLTLGVVLDQVTAQLNVDAADVLLFNPHLQTLEYAAGSGFRTKAFKGAQLSLGEGYAGRAALERHSVHIPNLDNQYDNPRLAKHLASEGFVAYYGLPLIAKGRVKGVLEVFQRAPLAAGPDWINFLETLAGQTAIAIDNAQLFNNLERSNVELSLAYDATIEGWSRALDLRDKETEGHTQRVTEMSQRLARVMGIDEAELVNMRRGALLHDIGKMGVPDSILLKPDKLTDEEWALMKKHPQFAFDMLSPIAYLKPALDIPYCHHEKWDGKGYPQGLKGEQIPLAARIFAIVDVWDALTSDRPYRPAWPKEKVREHIRTSSGRHFDPQVVEEFLKMPN